MKIGDLILALKKTSFSLPLVVHDNHQTYAIKEIKEDVVFGEKCFAIVVDRFPEKEGD